jgi:aminopeptidase YwaD
MYRSLLALLNTEVSGVAAKNLIARISQWHRIQASPMYREAAEWVHATLQGWGIASTLEQFPAREGVWAWAEPMFQEWNCEEGTLHLLELDGTLTRLADYREVPLSLLPRSIATDGEYEVVAVDGGNRLEDYARLDVRGKLVLTKRMPMSVHPIAIERLGAAGVIFDGMRHVPDVYPPSDLQDDIQYASWWWWGGETRAFGFAVTPRVGASLRNTIRRRAERGQPPVKVRARIRSQLYDGSIETVSAQIAGETDEQVLVMAHLCHPAPMANDNASGAAAVMEAARALNSLIASGRLPKPKRGIRFLWMPEMTGSYAYFAAHEHELPNFVAGLNLDMVGEDQNQTDSSWLLVRTSDAMPSFAAPLLEAIREGYFGEAHSFSGQGVFPMFRHAVVPFSNGSDHYILGDPSVGIATPLLIQWPDRFYHTTADTPEKVSPQSLQRAAALAATYAYFIATAGPAEVSWLAHEMQHRFETRVSRTTQSAITAALSGATPEGAPWEARLNFRVKHQEAALASLRKLDPNFDPQHWVNIARQFAANTWQRAHTILEGWQVSEREVLPESAARLIPKRRYRGPISLRPHMLRLPPEERAAAEDMLRQHSEFSDLPADVALYWADGKRNLAEILDAVELETGVRDANGLLAYMQLLARLELLELVEPSETHEGR